MGYVLPLIEGKFANSSQLYPWKHHLNVWVCRLSSSPLIWVFCRPSPTPKKKKKSSGTVIVSRTVREYKGHLKSSLRDSIRVWNPCLLNNILLIHYLMPGLELPSGLTFHILSWAQLSQELDLDSEVFGQFKKVFSQQEWHFLCDSTCRAILESVFVFMN